MRRATTMELEFEKQAKKSIEIKLPDSDSHGEQMKSIIEKLTTKPEKKQQQKKKSIQILKGNQTRTRTNTSGQRKKSVRNLGEVQLEPIYQ